VYIGARESDYRDLLSLDEVNSYSLGGNSLAVLAARISYLLDLKGANMPVTTGCSSSLVALHQACESIRSGHASIAMAGGVSVMCTPGLHKVLKRAGMLSPLGRCHAFDEQADGFVPAEGVGMLVLKSLKQARADQDRVHAVILGSGINYDGRSNGITAPSGSSQVELMERVYKDYAIDRDTIHYVETHGTGTVLGDPIEVGGLREIFVKNTGSVAIGSVKSNIGHALEAAGVAGVIKTVLSLKNAQLPPSLHFKSANRHIDFGMNGLRVNDHLTDWEAPSRGRRRASVSAFGFSGTNAHVVLEEFIHKKTGRHDDGQAWPVVLSAKDEAGLKRRLEQMADWLVGSGGTLPLERLAYTLSCRRDIFTRRFVVWVRNISELQECIDGVLNCGSSWRQDGLDPAQEQKSDDFLNGAEVSFEDLFAGTSSAQPLSLPGYPFSKESCWILEEDKVVQPDTIRLEAGHPLIRDHRYDGRCLLPAVGYLDALLSAARRGGLSLPLRFNQVFWLRPCFVDGAFSDLRIRETNSKGGLRQELSSIDTSGELLVHLKSDCQPLEAAAPEVGPVDFDFLEGVEIDAALVYQRFEKLGLGLGPALQTVRRVKVAGDVVWAELETGDSTAWQDPNFLEPALLDGALQSFMATVSDEAASFYAPFGVRRVDFFRPLIGGGISKLMPQLTSQRGNEQIVLNLEIYDRLGLLAIRMEGFESRRFEKEIPLPEHSWFAAEWVSRHLDEMKDVAAEPIHWIGRDGLSYDEALQKTWSAESGRLQAIVELDVLAGDKEVRPDQLTHRLSKWIHHFCAGNAVADKSIVVVANGTEQHGWAGGLRALLATASQEYENFRGHVYCCDDLSNTKRGLSSGERSVVSQLIRSNEPCGHWRTVSGGLQRQNWGVIEPTVFELKPGGVYLITGGMGAMGLELARSLCSQRNGQVILVGRAEANAAIQEALDTLNQERKCASYFSVNLSDAAAVQRLADWTKEQYPHLDGVFHAAGVTQDGLMGEKDAAAFAATWEPKVEGLSTLNQSGLFADRPFLFLFSSLSAVFGNRGQADYAFANACLNEWSARFDSKAVDAAWSRVVSVAWPYVEEGGMQVDVLRIERMAAKTGMKAMPLRCVLPMVEAALSLEAPVLALSFGERARCQKLFEGSFSELSAHEVPVEVAVISQEVAYALLVDAVSTVLQLDQSKLTVEAPLSEYGFDSVNLTDLSEYLDAEHGMLIQPSTFFEYQNLGKLAELVATMLPVKVEVPPAIEKVISTPERKIGIKAEADIDEGVAIIGMSGRFPGSPDLDHFWKHLCAGENLISEVPADRWRSEDLRKLFAPEEMKHFDSVRWGGFIEDSDAFDADFFGISPREAALMDPQQRLFLESVWHAIEDAGYQPGDLSGTRTGVFAGVSSTDYHQLLLKQSDNVEPYQSTGMAHSVLTNRVSYLLNLKGPSRPFDTACSSSLIALHEAVESIRRGECDTALAGGVSLMFSPMVYLAFAKAGMLAPDGRCKAFDEAADGYVRGEGVGVVLLKSLSAARRDGDSIYAVVRGSSENHGGHTPSLTAPNPIAQAELIEQAWARAGCRPEGLGLIEAHGTGTRLGDPIECNALRRVHQSIGF
ncbi:MAG: SDR family NAD(P)-dependent oxidoreductase, partial [Verrucomicrobiales bacterium]